MSLFESESESTLLRRKRAVLRSIHQISNDIKQSVEETASSDLVQKLLALLESWQEELDSIDSRLLDLLDVKEDLTDVQISEQEVAITKERIASRHQLALLRGRVSAIRERLQQTKALRQSLNSSFIGNDVNTSNTYVKLPDIPVPKFDGKIENFTEWISLYNATIHNNERLSDIQKMYFIRQAMTGSATDVLKDYPIDEKIYPEAYQHVMDRFFNRRRIIAKHFEDLVDLPTITYSSLRESIDKVNASVRGLKVCGIDVAKMSPMFTFLTVRKLPDRLRTDWETSQKDHTMYPSLDQLSTFVSDRCHAYESTSKAASSSSSSNTKLASAPTSSDRTKSKVTLAAVASSKKSNAYPRKCTICAQEHYTSTCPTLTAKSVPERIVLVREKRLCLNCLRPGHMSNVCYSTNKCQTCGKSHHTSLHENDVPAPQPGQSAGSSAPLTSMTIVKSNSNVILLPTAVVKVRVKSRWTLARILVDSCSQVNLVSETFAKTNRFVTRASSIKVVGVSPHGLQTSSAVTLTIQSRTSDYCITFEANIVGKIPYEISPDIIQRIESINPRLEFADSGYSPNTVDILIGGQFASQILLGDKQRYGDLYLEKSTFGWIATGPVNRNSENTRFCHLSVTVKDALSKFWEVEEVSTSKAPLLEHELCEQHFDVTHTRLSNGRFQIRLPFKPNATPLADTYAQAKSALIRYESKLDRKTRDMYIDFMQEYRRLRHMEKAPYFPVTSEKYFIPHLPVLRLDNTTTPLRVVFNASARISRVHHLMTYY